MHFQFNNMKLLIAPIHYFISETDGSEYTRAFENLKYISEDKNYFGDVLVGYSDVDRIGNFKIHKMLTKKPSSVSIYARIRFIIWVFYKGLLLTRENKYDCIWHQGPFAIGETFSLLAFFNMKRTRFIIGPIFTPFPDKGKISVYEKSADGKIVKVSLWKKIDRIIYKYFSKTFYALSLLTLRSANKIITVEKFGEEILKSKKIKNVETITIGVIDKNFSVKPRSKKDRKLVLLSVNYLTARKRVEDLILALKILVNKYHIKNLKLIIVGDGPEMQNLKDLTSMNNLNKYVSFEGLLPRTKVGKYYKNADIFLAGSVQESMPGMYFEAMNASLPMVLAENISSMELGKNKFGGFIVKQKRPDLIAEATSKIIKNSMLYKELSLRNYNLMQSTYNFKLSMEKLKKAFVA